MFRHEVLAAFIAAILATPAALSREESLEPIPEAAPPPPPRVQSGESLEPEVTIRADKEGQVEEYRVSGRLYMVKVTPSIGKPYYLVDSDGDGKLESRMSQLNSNFVVPSWVIFSWD
ncbi:MAG: hypothetical protein NFCOHLIN_01751 [Gammaproteobacteria bacterium]|nr:hypothetical protein [Gammaproteobacteria bacterium]